MLGFALETNFEIFGENHEWANFADDFVQRSDLYRG